jgi:GTP-binding protein
MQTHTARFAGAASDPGHLPAFRQPEVAFAGRSNVGKSSLLNRLVGHKGLARVSKTPGRTQQINFFLIDEQIVFVDLPGYGFARVPLEVQGAWKGLVEGYLANRPQLAAVCVLVDMRRGPAEDDLLLLDYLASLSLPSFVALTKVDKLARGPRLLRCREIAAQLPGTPVIATSAAKSEGMDELWAQIHAAAGGGDTRYPGSGNRRKS